MGNNLQAPCQRNLTALLLLCQKCTALLTQLWWNPLYNTLSQVLGIILVIQSGETSKESFSSGISASLNTQIRSPRPHTPCTFTFRVGARGLRLSWMKPWWTQANAGNCPASRWKWPNDHDLRRSFPTNSSVSPWARTWAAQEIKTKTAVAEEARSS